MMDAEIEILDDGFDEFTEKLKEEAMEKLMEIANEILFRAKVKLIENRSVVFGRLFESGYIEKVGDDEVEVGFEAPYAGFVEFGTGPRARLPPIEPLKMWAKVKFRLDDKEAERVAWAVAKWIKEHGTQPHPFFRPALYEVVEEEKE